VLLPSFPEDYGSEDQLIQDIRSFLDKWHEQRSKKERELDIAYVFTTWIYDLLSEVPYRRSIGRWGEGKTAWIDTVGSICYRPMYTAGCSSEASLRRTFDLWRGTALIDEADFSHSDLYAAVVKMLNVGFSKMHGYYRCCDENDASKVLSFYVYGPKLLATRESFKDTALESRCLTFPAFENITPKPLYRMDMFNKEALSLRNKLLLWRLKNYHIFKEKASKLEDVQLINELFKGVDVKSRIKQILTPLALISNELKDGIVNLAKELSEELKALDPEAEFEEEVKAAVISLKKRDQVEPLNVLNLYREGGSTFRIKVKDLAEVMLQADLKEEKINPGSLRGLTTKLGLFFRRIGIKVKQEDRGYNYAYIPEEWLNLPSDSGSKGSNVQHFKEEECFWGKCSYCGMEGTIEGSVDGYYVCGKCFEENTKKEEQEQKEPLGGTIKGSTTFNVQPSLASPPADLKSLEVPPNLDIEVQRLDPQDFVKTTCAYCNQDTTIVAYLGAWPICFDCLKQQLEEAKKRWQA